MMTLAIDRIERITERIRLFTLVSPDGAPLPEYEAGAHVDIDLGKLGTRSYSLVDFEPRPAGGRRHWNLAIQREDEGRGGSRALHALSVDDTIGVSAPKNDFRLHDEDAPALLIAGGIGVTPIISFATELTRRGTPFAFHYATRSASLCAFRDRLRDAFGSSLRLWFDDDRMIDPGALIAAAAPDTHIYCCGPRGMIEATREKAEAAGFDKAHVHFELFSSAQTGEADRPFEIELAGTGQVFTVPAGRSIVEVLEEAGIEVMYDCARGDCGICQTNVISGTPDHRDVVLSDAERASGKVMQICVSRAKSARLVLDL